MEAPGHDDRDREELTLLAGSLARIARRARRAGRRVPAARHAGAARPNAPSASAAEAGARDPGASAPGARDARARETSARDASSRDATSRDVAERGAAARAAGTSQDPRSTASRDGAENRADVARQASECQDLETLARAVAQCRACSLCKTRTQTVFMDGEGTKRLMFVGEAPGAEEDRRGVPFVGRAGELLTDIITKGMGLARKEVHIANVVKCRPPDNREPTTEEKETCTPWLERQIELTDPELIVPLGKHAATYLLGLQPQTPMKAMRGRVHAHRGRRIVATFHPAYLLRNPADKKECWKDIQLAMETIGMQKPRSASES